MLWVREWGRSYGGGRGHVTGRCEKFKRVSGVAVSKPSCESAGIGSNAGQSTRSSNSFSTSLYGLAGCGKLWEHCCHTCPVSRGNGLLTTSGSRAKETEMCTLAMCT